MCPLANAASRCDKTYVIKTYVLFYESTYYFEDKPHGNTKQNKLRPNFIHVTLLFLRVKKFQ